MEYIELNISVADPEQSEIVVALLSDYPFEAFDEAEGELRAYIQTAEWSQCQKWVESMLVEQGLRFAALEVEQQNWNAEWESSFDAVDVVGEKPIRIRAEHHPAPEAGVIDVVIAPRMSFGTGHHTTTALMSATIAAEDVAGKSGLDMGCGTALLAILAAMRGAKDVVAIDIDEFAYENALENIRLNNTDEIDVRLGGVETLREGESFDFVIANINRNILLADIKHYVQCMHKGSELFISGFYVEDIPLLQEEGEKQGLKFLASAEDNRWAMMQFVKE